MTKNKKRALSILKNTTTLKDGRYQIRLFWKEDIVNLPYNRNLAEKRLEGIKRKLSKNKELADKYRETIIRYINEGHTRKLTEKESETTSNITNYKPHHFALNPDKPDKVRVVYNATAKYQNVSLNNKGTRFVENFSFHFDIIQVREVCSIRRYRENISPGECQRE